MSGYIPFIRVSKLKDRELESVMTLIVKLLIESGLSLEIITKIITQFTSLLGKFQQAMNKNRASELTAQIREVDEKRNNLVASLFKGVDYFLTLLGTPMEEAAKIVDPLLEKYGMKIIHESDMITTVKIRSLVKELKDEEVVTATDTLGITAVVNSLEQTNEEFDALYLKRANDDAGDATPNLVPTRKDINELLLTTVYLFNFLYKTEPQIYSKVAGEMAEIIGDIMAVAKARETRKNHGEETVEENTGTEESVDSE